MNLIVSKHSYTGALGLDPEKVTFSELMADDQMLDGVEALSAGGAAFAALFQFRDGAIEIIGAASGEQPPSYPADILDPLIRRLQETRDACHDYLPDGRLIVAYPIWLYHASRAYLKGCFAGIPPVLADASAGPDAMLQAAKFMAELCSHRISSAFKLLLERSEWESLQRDLRLGSSQLAAAMDNIGAAMVLIDKDMTIVWHNSTALKITGCSSLLGKRCYETVFGAQDVCPNCLVQRTIESGLSQSGVNTAVFPCLDQGVRYHKVTTIPAFNEAGEVSQVLEIIYDVTQSRIAESELARYKCLVDSSQDFMLIANELGDIIAVNRKITSVLGYSEEELVGKNGSMLIPSYELNRGITLAENARLLGMAMESIHLLKKDGGLIPCQAFISFNRELSVFEATFRDISERLRMEEEIRKRSEQLQKQNGEVRAAMEEKTRFFRNVSHELRTPITSVIGFAELLLEDTDEHLSDRQKLALERITGNARKLLVLVNDLLDLSKLDASAMQMNLTEIKLNNFLEQVVANMAPLTIGKNVALKVQVPDNTPVIVSDEQKLGQILVNLISNSIKFTAEGSVTVSAAKNGRSVTISVADTGVGIPKQELRNIFREFYQVGRQESGSRGTGLGLTIASKLVTLLGGEISVKSKVGAGSTFSVKLPLKPRA